MTQLGQTVLLGWAVAATILAGIAVVTTNDRYRAGFVRGGDSGIINMQMCAEASKLEPAHCARLVKAKLQDDVRNRRVP